jgi:hypothetical protein
MAPPQVFWLAITQEMALLEKVQMRGAFFLLHGLNCLIMVI